MRKLFFILPVLMFLACESEEQAPLDPEVIAEVDIFSISEVGDNEFTQETTKVGKATFYQTGSLVSISISLSNMEPNSHKAVHIHSGSVETPGRHWNAGSFISSCRVKSLGKTWQKMFVGDVGNVPIDKNGNGSFELRTDLWAINSGDDKDILGKVLIVHENLEDFATECDPAHRHDTHSHFNPKIAAGTITLVSEVPLADQQMSVKTEQMPDFLICK